MKNIYLISTSVLKENSAINGNVDDSLLLNAILEAQDIELQQILGQKLYTRILADIDNDSLGGDYKQLVDDYCQKVVIYYATARAIPYIHFKVMNKGVQNQNSDNSTPTAFNEMNYLAKKIQNDAEFYAQRLSDYLHGNAYRFPEYLDRSCPNEIKPSGSQYRCGLVLEDTQRCCGNSYNLVDIIY